MQMTAQVVLAHPPASLWPFLKDLSSADASRCRISSCQGVGSNRQITDTPSTEQIEPGCYSTPEDPLHPMFASIYVAVLPVLEITFCSPYETSLAGWHRRHSGLARPGLDNSKRELPDQHESSAQKRRILPQGLWLFHASAYIESTRLRFSVLTGSSHSPPRLAL